MKRPADTSVAALTAGAIARQVDLEAMGSLIREHAGSYVARAVMRRFIFVPLWPLAFAAISACHCGSANQSSGKARFAGEPEVSRGPASDFSGVGDPWVPG